MKKIISAICLALALVCCFSTTACGKKAKLAIGKEMIKYDSQLDALIKLNEGEVDACVIDSVMAGYYSTTGDLAGKVSMVEGIIDVQEEYGIAGRKNDKAFISKINEALIAIANEDYAELNEAYGLEASAIVTGNTTNPLANSSDDSWNTIVNSGKIVIGYTVFAPIAYMVDNKLTGYDIELAQKVVEYLNENYETNITLEFVEIDWDAKETLLNGGTIDLIWNGLTITSERSANMCISIPYLKNKQVVVVKTTDLEKYTTLESLKKVVVGVEKGSAGEDVVKG